jgi:hypothetical protein
MGITVRLHRENIEADVRIILRGRYSLEKGDGAAALATYIVREIERMFPTRPVGRSLLQKLFFVLSKEGLVDASFHLFMNGPYSDWVENALCRAVESGMMTAVKENGRSRISARGGLFGEVPTELQEKASQCVRAYGFHEEGDLAILTTALYLEDHVDLGPDELVKAVIAVNPRFDVRRVCSLLDRSDVVFRSW